MKAICGRCAALLLGLIACAAPLWAQQPAAPATGAPAKSAAAITPLRGQTAEKTALDDAECKNTATSATGFVPGAAPPAPTAASGPHGQRLAGAARGAAAGAVVGEVQGNNSIAPEAVQDEHRQNQAQAGAAVGVMAGGARARQERRHAAQAQQAATQQHAASQSAWQNSYKACVTQRGYSVP